MNYIAIKSAIILASLVTLSGCGETADDSWTSEQMDRNNNPEDVAGGANFDYYLPQLADSGEVSGVWTGSWWPLSQGGTVGPLRKLDRITNGQGLASAWEQKTVDRYGDVSWAGHCNGLAAAGTMTKEPRNSVRYDGVDFGVEDIKALLVETWQGGGRIVGGRCNEEQLETDEYGRYVRAECRGMNAGTFHLGITNFLGKFKKPLILDVSSGVMVWNYAVVSFEIESQEEVSSSEASELLGARGNYRFNHNAVAFMRVKMNITLVTGQRKTYEYIIEGDSRGDVIGGEWIGSSKSSHPDFMWRHTRPTPENPHLDISTIKKIYRASL